MKWYPAAWVGFAVLLVMHFAGGGWWLNAPDRVRNMLTALGMVAFAVGLASKNLNVYPALHLVFGFSMGMAVFLFIMESNLWPIAVAIGTGMALLAIVPTFAMGLLMRVAIDALRRRYAS